MISDSSTIIKIFGLEFSLETLLATLTFLGLLISGLYKFLQSRTKYKPEIIDIIASHNGSKVVLTIKNNSDKTIKVEKLFIKVHKLLFLWLSTILVDNPHIPSNAYVFIPPNESRESSVYPPDAFYLSTYKIYAKTEAGTCSIIYDPAKVKGLKIRIKIEHISL